MQIGSLSFMNAIEWEGKLWFFENRWHALCSLDFDLWELTIEDVYTGSVGIEIRNIFAMDDKVFLFSQSGFQVLIYEKTKRLFRLLIWGENGNESQRAIGIHARVEDKVYIVPAIPKFQGEKIVIARFDLITEQFQRYFLQPRERIAHWKEGLLCFPSIFEHGICSGWVPHNQWLYANLVTGEYSIQTIKGKQILPYAVCKDGKRIWMTDQQCSDIFCVDGTGNLLRFLVSGKAEQPYSCILALSDYLIALPRFSDMVVLIDKNNMQIHPVPIGHLLPRKCYTNTSKCLSCTENNNYILLHPLGMHHLIKIDKNNLVPHAVSIWCDRKKFLCSFPMSNFYMQEVISVWDSSLFLEYVSKNKTIRKEVYFHSESVGYKIYKQTIDIKKGNICS